MKLLEQIKHLAKQFYRYWMKFAHFIGEVNTRIILSLLYFIIFGLLGCLVVMNTLGYTADAFFQRLYQAITPMDYIGGVIKTFILKMIS